MNVVAVGPLVLRTGLLQLLMGQIEETQAFGLILIPLMIFAIVFLLFSSLCSLLARSITILDCHELISRDFGLDGSVVRRRRHFDNWIHSRLSVLVACFCSTMM